MPWSAVRQRVYFPLADLLVEERQQLRQLPVRPERDVEDLLRVRPPGVADDVVARKADRQQVRHVVLAELLGDDGRLDQLQQKVVAERRVGQGVVVRLARPLEAPVDRVRKRDPLPNAFAFPEDRVRPAVLYIVEVRPESIPGWFRTIDRRGASC